MRKKCLYFEKFIVSTLIIDSIRVQISIRRLFQLESLPSFLKFSISKSSSNKLYLDKSSSLPLSSSSSSSATTFRCGDFSLRGGSLLERFSSGTLLCFREDLSLDESEDDEDDGDRRLLRSLFGEGDFLERFRR